MAKQTVNLGTSANKGDGDPLRTSFDKINDNFDELYADKFDFGIRLPVRAVAPDSPTDGDVAIADGINWDPLNNNKQTMIVYLGGAWVQIAVAV